MRLSPFSLKEPRSKPAQVASSVGKVLVIPGTARLITLAKRAPRRLERRAWPDGSTTTKSKKRCSRLSSLRSWSHHQPFGQSSGAHPRVTQLVLPLRTGHRVRFLAAHRPWHAHAQRLRALSGASVFTCVFLSQALAKAKRQVCHD